MTQAQKLGLRPGSRVCLDAAPGEWMLEDPPDGIELVPAPQPADIIVAFVRRADELAPRVAAWGERVYPAGALWIAWPRKAGGHISDLGDQLVRRTVLEFGLVDVKVAALDADWSALEFVWRVENRGHCRPPAVAVTPVTNVTAVMPVVTAGTTGTTGTTVTPVTTEKGR